jgi:hypothetical protein
MFRCEAMQEVQREQLHSLGPCVCPCVSHRTERRFVQADNLSIALLANACPEVVTPACGTDHAASLMNERAGKNDPATGFEKGNEHERT